MTSAAETDDDFESSYMLLRTRFSPDNRLAEVSLHFKIQGAFVVPML